jgi:uncharacterized membrane protein
LVGTYLYPTLPEKIAIHWDVNGEADGYASKLIGLFLLPVISLFLLPLMLILPKLDPTKGIKKFKEGYDWFLFGFIVFMSIIYSLSLLWNLGYKFDMMRLMAPAIGVLFYGIGVLMEKMRLNWFVGIRTPWTLSSEDVWDKTHQVGAKAFKTCGVLAFLGILANGWLSLLFTLVPVLVASIYLTYFSYSEHQKISAPQ